MLWYVKQAAVAFATLLLIVRPHGMEGEQRPVSLPNPATEQPVHRKPASATTVTSNVTSNVTSRWRVARLPDDPEPDLATDHGSESGTTHSQVQRLPVDLTADPVLELIPSQSPADSPQMQRLPLDPEFEEATESVPAKSQVQRLPVDLTADPVLELLPSPSPADSPQMQRLPLDPDFDETAESDPARSKVQRLPVDPSWEETSANSLQVGDNTTSIDSLTAEVNLDVDRDPQEQSAADSLVPEELSAAHDEIDPSIGFETLPELKLDSVLLPEELPAADVEDNANNADNAENAGNDENEDDIDWPWWIARQAEPVSEQRTPQEITLLDAFSLAISCAPDLQILQVDRRIARQTLLEEDAQFDWATFLSAQWDDRSNPVGSALDGVQGRSRGEQYSSNYGLRRNNRLGGEVQLSQGFGWENSNSSFFNPANQGTAGLALTYSQPILRDGGYEIATASIRIAASRIKATDADYVSGFQQHLLEVAEAFWSLYRQRARARILEQSYRRAEELRSIMQKRMGLDVDKLQLSSASSTAADRYSEYLQAEADIDLLQESLLRLLFGSRYPEVAEFEFIPVGVPYLEYEMPSMKELTTRALKFRTEITSAIQDIRVACIENDIAKNRMLPGLEVTLAVSANGLRGNYDVANAWYDQFRLGEPTYGIGLTYEYPIRNAAATAAHRRALLFVKRRQLEFQATVGDIALEVRSAGVRARAAIETQQARLTAWEARRNDMEVSEKRFKLLVEGAEVGRLYLDNLLATQQQLATAELSLLGAQIDSELRRIQLERSSGTFLNYIPAKQ